MMACRVVVLLLSAKKATPNISSDATRRDSGMCWVSAKTTATNRENGVSAGSKLFPYYLQKTISPGHQRYDYSLLLLIFSCAVAVGIRNWGPRSTVLANLGERFLRSEFLCSHQVGDNIAALDELQGSVQYGQQVFTGHTRADGLIRADDGMEETRSPTSAFLPRAYKQTIAGNNDEGAAAAVRTYKVTQRLVKTNQQTKAPTIVKIQLVMLLLLRTTHQLFPPFGVPPAIPAVERVCHGGNKQ